jgi:hypothetical protein
MKAPDRLDCEVARMSVIKSADRAYAGRCDLSKGDGGGYRVQIVALRPSRARPGDAGRLISSRAAP